MDRLAFRQFPGSNDPQPMPRKAGREPAECVVVIASEQGRKIGIPGSADVLPETIRAFSPALETIVPVGRIVSFH
jgi:hypothetical protein